MTQRENEMRERILSIEGQLVKAATMITEARERAEAAEKRLLMLEQVHKDLAIEYGAVKARAEAAEDKLLTIRQWCEAYPLDIFPEPDHGKAQELLKAGGMTLDAVSASAMRHVVTRLKETVDLKSEKF